MKDFVKMTLAVVCGTVIIGILGAVLSLGVIGSMAALGSAKPTLPKEGVLKIDMSKIQLAEQSIQNDPISMIQGQERNVIGILEAIRSINAAAKDPSIKFIYLKPDGMQTGLASLQEFRAALENFRTSGKPIIAYTENTTTGGYYLASVADKIYMTSHPGATTMFNGVSTQLIFLKDLLDKFGVNIQFIRHGKYKAAGETFVRSTASPENLEQNQVMVDAIWNSYARQIAQSRGITVADLNNSLDNLELAMPDDYLEKGYVDGLLTRSELEHKIAELAVAQNFKDVKMISLADYATVKATPAKLKDQIAIIYFDGEIVDGNDPKDIAGDRFAKMIAKVRADSTIKAVVMRVNSPGGSVIASDKIKAELDLLAQRKPLVASLGNYAASGGYWISANADKIFAEETTITGSIGVFGMVPDISKTLKDVAHVNITSVKSNPHADMMSLTRPLDNAEYEYMLKGIEYIYDKFTGLVAQGRSLEKSYVDEIGQGRVWTGADALKIGLVDETGTLEDALQWAAVAAGNSNLDEWGIAQYPSPMSQIEQMLYSIINSGNGIDDNDVLVKEARKLKDPKTLAHLPYKMRFVF